MFSAPYEPVRFPADRYVFAVGKSRIKWTVVCKGVEIEMSLSLPKEEPIELRRLKVKNLSDRQRKLSVYPYFTVGYMSWSEAGNRHTGAESIYRRREGGRRYPPGAAAGNGSPGDRQIAGDG